MKSAGDEPLPTLMRNLLFSALLTAAFCTQTLAQSHQFSDTLKGVGEDIVVTANRSERKLSNVAVPVTLLSKTTIQQTGSLRLQDILQEQTGLVLVNSPLASTLSGYPNPFGQGIQMMGLDPAYTAILLDGEPLIGRNAGILKLGRLATGNIRQVEIIKGPSSSLYGSEAMAGVINIITDPPSGEAVDLQLHHATNDTWGTTLSYRNRFARTGVQFFINRYSTGGYDLDPMIYGKTVDPSRDWTGQLKIQQEISSKAQLKVSLRNYDSRQDNNYQVYTSGVAAIALGSTREQERSAFAQLRLLLNTNSRLYLRTSYDRYVNRSFVDLDKTTVRFDETSFDQSLIKPEVQYERSRPGRSQYVAGFGAALESIEASRYAGLQRVSTVYAFTQKEWYLLQQKLTIIAGGRIDKRSDFAAHLSPRLALAYKAGKYIKLTASAGWGFKAPDFRHMYLNFYNAQVGYSLLGSRTLSDELQKLQQQGLLQNGADISPYLATKDLRPETSFGMHAGVKYSRQALSAEAGFFRNDIDHLIDVYALPFTRSNGLPVYSYHNVSSVFIQGFQTDISYRISPSWVVSGGYQFLDAKDKQVLKNIDNGTVYKRDPVTFQTTLVTRSNYYGLANRSKNSGNAKILYDNRAHGFDAYLRVVYRGRYGVSDVNGNNIIDDSREMTAGYAMVNIAASKTIGNHFRLQAGVENLFNYTNPTQLANIAGRLFFLNLNYSIDQLFTKTKTHRS